MRALVALALAGGMAAAYGAGTASTLTVDHPAYDQWVNVSHSPEIKWSTAAGDASKCVEREANRIREGEGL